MTQVKMPEPVAYRYRVIDDEWEYSEQSFFADGGSPGDQEESDSLITTTQAEAYADARVREALEEAAMIPRAYAESLDRQGWGNRFPDELTAIFNASTNMADRIRALMPPLSGPVEP